MKKFIFLLFMLSIYLVGNAQNYGNVQFPWSPNTTITNGFDVQLPNNDVVSFNFEYSGNHLWWQGFFSENPNVHWYNISCHFGSDDHPEGIYPTILDYYNPMNNFGDLNPESILYSEFDFSSRECDNLWGNIEIRDPYTNQVIKSIDVLYTPITNGVQMYWQVL